MAKVGDDGALGSVEAALDESGLPVVRLRGEIDISNAEAIGARLELLVEGRSDRVVVDLSNLNFMDSSGIAMLLHVVDRFGSVAIRNPTNVVRRIIESTGLTDILPMEPVEPIEPDATERSPG
jgi:anti-sigma B factor antagonist